MTRFCVASTQVAAYLRSVPVPKRGGTIRFENVNPGYAGQASANVFVFNTYLSVAPTPGTQYLKNPAFSDENADGNFGDYWSSYGTVGFNEFFGPGNPHASFFADTINNAGGIYQQALLGTPGGQYRYDLRNVRIEAAFDADLYFGLEYYGDDDYTKLGETIVPIDTTTTGDGLSFHMIGTAVAGTVYVRPVVFFDNVGTTGGTDRNAFIFAASLTEVPDTLPGDLNCDDVVNFADINPFVLRLINPAEYSAAFPDCPDANGDLNGNGSVGFEDINPFVDLLVGGK